MNWLIASQSMMAINKEMEKDKEGNGYGVCIRVGHKAGPCTATFNDLLCFKWLWCTFKVILRITSRDCVILREVRHNIRLPYQKLNPEPYLDVCMYKGWAI
jgi:hypothetical protein